MNHDTGKTNITINFIIGDTHWKFPLKLPNDNCLSFKFKKIKLNPVQSTSYNYWRKVWEMARPAAGYQSLGF